MKYIPAWDGLRCFLLAGVLIFHFYYSSAHVLWWLSYSLPAFFVLSGYLITQLILATEEKSLFSFLKKFYFKRALRILPVYYIVLFTAVLTCGYKFFIWAAVYLLNIKMFIFTFPSFTNPGILETLSSWQYDGLHYWSMSVEEQFYIIYPLALIPLVKKNRFRLIICSIILSIVARNLFQNYYPRSFYGGLPFISGEYIMWGCLFGLIEFYKVNIRIAKENIFSVAVGLGTLSLVIFGRHTFYKFGIFIPGNEQTLYAISIVLFIHGLKVDPDHWVSKFLSYRGFIYIGKISYGVYLVHLFSVNLYDWIANNIFPSIIIFPKPLVLIALSFIMGVALWHFIDVKINNFRKRILP
jgi:peptidoglycan/LPS O-acetylase OafA/YrhL